MPGKYHYRFNMRVENKNSQRMVEKKTAYYIVVKNAIFVIDINTFLN